MCGIAGIWGDAAPEALLRMMKTMAHRGPDAEGVYESSLIRGALGHRRLSIMDPEGGNQPIRGERDGEAIVANGEIYNFRVLHDSLSKRHAFRTRSDTESALHLYQDHGSGAAQRLDGMFAFAIADGEDLYMARDAIGIKPLYYGKKGESMVFASELKALIGVATDVLEFPPGSYYHSRHGFRRFYAVPEREPKDMPLKMRLRLLRKTLERAVEKRMMSDVPLGAFLSGGLDSSIIAAMARQHVDTLHTFSVGLEGSEDLEAARRVARYLDTEHHEYVFTIKEALACLPQLVYYLESFDQDLVRSGLPCFFVSRLAAETVKVILTGEGADELFAGYRYYKDITTPQALHQELRRSVCALHNVNLQRVDRMTMAHSIEGRVPFLDTELIEFAQTIPPELKLRADGSGPPVEKWILRKACEDLLPPEIIWRDKQQFDEGTGTADMLAEEANRRMSEAEANAYRAKHPGAHLRSREECLYHQMLTDVYGDIEPILKNVGRWSQRPDLN